MPILIEQIKQFSVKNFGETFNLPIYIIKNLFLINYTNTSLLWRLIPIINIIVLINIIILIFRKKAR